MSNLSKLASLIPLYELEQGAQQQIYDALRLPFLKKLAVMPDCHTGYTLPIGGVALLDKVISPQYVGYDIGCGMTYVSTDDNWTTLLSSQDDKERIFDEMYIRIPIGLGVEHKGPQNYKEFKSAIGDKKLDKEVNKKLGLQLGTLGSGNHFIEIGINNSGKVSIVIHSGSRKVGHLIASHYMSIAKNYDKHLPNGFLDITVGEFGQAYLHDMNFALEYALENRSRMMIQVLEVLGYNKDISKFMKKMVNENHNHAIITKDGVLHRKGATPAEKGQIGIIPGSMKTGTYITSGLGNEVYLNSASHGAGRKMSRGKAKKSITMDRFKEQMKGIIAKVDKGTLDEAPDAYKNVKKVIKSQEGIVIETIDHIKPLINVKG